MEHFFPDVFPPCEATWNVRIYHLEIHSKEGFFMRHYFNCARRFKTFMKVRLVSHHQIRQNNIYTSGTVNPEDIMSIIILQAGLKR
jgi:hypothetical protein